MNVHDTPKRTIYLMNLDGNNTVITMNIINQKMILIITMIMLIMNLLITIMNISLVMTRPTIIVKQ